MTAQRQAQLRERAATIIQAGCHCWHGKPIPIAVKRTPRPRTILFADLGLRARLEVKEKV